MPRVPVLLVAVCLSCHPPAPGVPAAPDAGGVAIRINQLGYQPDAPKVAVVCALVPRVVDSFRIVDQRNHTVFGPHAAEYRLDVGALRQPGGYRILAAGATSPLVRIADDVYRGAADSLLAYLREQRSGYNPVFRDSVHQRTDGILADD